LTQLGLQPDRRAGPDFVPFLTRRPVAAEGELPAPV